MTQVARWIADEVEPPEPQSLDEWAEEYRYISRQEGAAEPGPFRWSRTPYLKGVAQKLDPRDPCRRVVVKKGVQIGATTLAELLIGYIIDRAPAPILVVLSTQELQQRWANTRLARMIETTPALASKVGKLGESETGNRKRGPESALVKAFPGGYIVVGIATSKSSLASVPARILIRDEVNRWPAFLPGEGSPMEIAEKRTTTFGDAAKIYDCSTPTVAGQSPIGAAYDGSDQRKWEVECPYCGERQFMRWGQVKWSEIDRPPEEAAYQCEHCDGIIEEHQRADFVASGRWVPTAEGPYPGYHVPGFLSTLGVTLGQLSQEFVDAKRAGAEALQVFINTRLGEDWEETDAGRSSTSELMQKRHAWWQPKGGGRGVPHGVWLLTAGIDLQENPPRIECEVVGWGRQHEHWSIDYRVFSGDPAGTQLWEDLATYLDTAFPCEGGGAMGIEAACIDTGWSSKQVYDFVREQSRRRRIWAIKGKSYATQRAQRPIWPKKPSRVGGSKPVSLHVINVDGLKAAVYMYLKVPVPGPGFAHHDLSWTEADFEQLTAEKRITDYKGGFAYKRWTKPKGKPNERLDCRAYAAAALEGIKSYGRTLESFRGAARREVDTDAPARAQRGRRTVRPRRKDPWRGDGNRREGRDQWGRRR